MTGSVLSPAETPDLLEKQLLHANFLYRVPAPTLRPFGENARNRFTLRGLGFIQPPAMSAFARCVGAAVFNSDLRGPMVWKNTAARRIFSALTALSTLS
jgi:hypothetical protein